MTHEFSNYENIEKFGINGKLVTYNLVNEDWPPHNVEQFFGCQNPTVEYCLTLQKAIDKIKTTTEKLMFYPTQIPVCERVKRKVHIQ